MHDYWTNNLTRRTRHGTALVEMALALLLLMLLTMGAIEYGWFFLKQQQITNAARQGARIASTADASTSDATTYVGTLMTNYGMGSSGYTASASPTEVKGLARGTSISYTVSVPYSAITITNFKLLPLPTTVSATVAMEKEGP